MDQDYQDLIETVSHQIAQTFLDHESNVPHRALLVDADIAELTRQIGLETTKIVLTRSRDHLVKKNTEKG